MDQVNNFVCGGLWCVPVGGGCVGTLLFILLMLSGCKHRPKTIIYKRTQFTVQLINYTFNKMLNKYINKLFQPYSI